MRAAIAIFPPLSLTATGLIEALYGLYFEILTVSFLGIAVVILGSADAFGRYKDYRYLSRFNYLTEHLAQFYGRSFCGRWVVASIEPGWRKYYHRHGYRWYHVLPSGFPAVLFQRRFWHNLFKGHRI